jgi:hypothetical protein
LDQRQDPSDRSYQEKPAYQRAGKPEPINRPVPGSKPSINLADPRQAAAYKTQLDLEKAGVPLNKTPKDPLDSVRPGTQAKPNYSLANDPVGKATAGEPSLGKVQPAKAPVSTSTAKPVTATAQSQYQQAANTVANIRKGLGKSSEYTNIYAPLGPTNFMDKQYIKDLEAELAKTPDDANLKQELDRMNKRVAPKVPSATATNNQSNTANVAPVSTTAKSTNLNPVTSTVNTAATSRGGLSPGQSVRAPAAPVTAAPAAKPSASTGTSAPAQSAYKGSTGAQSIQAQNADKIADVNKIRAGDTIKVAGQDYTIKSGDTLDSIAKNQQSTTTTKSDAFPNTTNGVGSILNAPKSKPEDDSDNQLTNVIPNDRMAEENKSLNRIKSLAGLK